MVTNKSRADGHLGCFEISRSLEIVKILTFDMEQVLPKQTEQNQFFTIPRFPSLSFDFPQDFHGEHPHTMVIPDRENVV